MSNKMHRGTTISLFQIRLVRNELELPRDAELLEDCKLAERAIGGDLDVNEARRLPAARERIARALRDRD